MTTYDIFGKCADMHFDDIIDPLVVSRLEREHEACVNDDAYEIHVADQASMTFMQALAAYPEGAEAIVHLACAEMVRGNLQEPLVGWVGLECQGRRTFIAQRAIVRAHVIGTARGNWSPTSARTFASVLREHQRVSGSLRLRLADGSSVCSHVSIAGADFVAIADGSLVPLASIDICELL